jgi:hypothetical protein
VGFVQAEDVHALVTAFEFDVAIVSSVPPIERFDDIDLTPVEANSLRYRDPMVVRRELNLNTHDLCGCAADVDREPGHDLETIRVPAIGRLLPTYEASIYVGFAAPGSTPVEIINTLNREINAALTDSAMLLRIAELGDTPLSLTTSEFAKLIVDETEKWSKVIRAANIRAE